MNGTLIMESTVLRSEHVTDSAFERPVERNLELILVNLSYHFCFLTGRGEALQVAWESTTYILLSSTLTLDSEKN